MELQRTKLSLFQIESDLRAIVEQRCDAQERLDELEQAHSAAPNESIGEAIHSVRDEITVADGLIRAYIGKEVQKVDGIAHVLLELEGRRFLHTQEADRLKMLAAGEEATAKRIKDMVLLVMDEFGVAKLEGAIHDLKAQGNGGLQALTIAQPDMVPLDLKRVTVELRADSAKDFAEKFAGQYRILAIAHPDPKDIRAKLESNEGVPGCRLEPRGKHLRIK